eukprot:1797835-Amphidinium_carterae.1
MVPEYSAMLKANCIETMFEYLMREVYSERLHSARLLIFTTSDDLASVAANRIAKRRSISSIEVAKILAFSTLKGGLLHQEVISMRKTCYHTSIWELNSINFRGVMAVP